MKIDFNSSLNIVIYILLINLFISIIYLVFRFLKKDYKRGLMMTVFIIIAPGVGPLYLIISWLLYEVYFKNRKGILNIEELSFRQDRVEVIVKDNIQTALDKVPVEEALIVSNTQSTRKLLLNILKEDTSEYINSIYSATDNKDSEVAHYAAAAITDIMDKFKEKEKVLKEAYHNNDKNPEIAQVYWKYINEFLNTKILPRVEQERYLDILEKLTIKLEKDIPTIINGEIYYKIVSMSIDLERMKKAEVWVNRALDKRGDDLESYKAALKFYYSNGNMDKFLKLLKYIMKSNIKLDNETLEIIRFYK